MADIFRSKVKLLTTTLKRKKSPLAAEAFMKKIVTRVALLAALMFENCKPVEKHQSMPQDPHSFSIPSDARVNHLRWKAIIDFDLRLIQATASWDIASTPDTDIIIFDTKGLVVKKITLDNDQPTEFRLAAPDSLLGSALAIMIRPGTKRINIDYQTAPDAEALQWLAPQQTAGKKYPFLFTQSQAILARSWIPCQDTPGVRFTYEADVTVPGTLLPLMSASNPQKKNTSGSYHFEMSQPIASYLLALAVGDLEFKAVSERSGIYAEPDVLDAAVWEFADLEKMIEGAEKLYGAYPWERYDVIVLPPSFPFGGMENPRLTFATPSILAGDRSLTSLIAHELAHSWSGNLVTNSTWNDFWLNEGFTVYFEHRIMEKLYGRDYSEMLAVLALQDLKETVASLQAENKYADTRLQLDLTGRNPDEGVTDIAYNKGYFFLRLIEERYGRDKIDVFLRDYFSMNAFKSMDTETFIRYMLEYYRKNFSEEIPESMVDEWVFTSGLSEKCPQPVSVKFDSVDLLLAKWNSSKVLDKPAAEKWTTHEWMHFLKNLSDPLSPEQMVALDSFGNFTSSGNAEITTLWLVKAIRNNYRPADQKLEQFLETTGRRKFLMPLYSELRKTDAGKKRAAEIYELARPNYHFVATSSIDALLK